MKICSIELTSQTLSQLRTEILFSIASSRSQGEELVEFVTGDSMREKIEKGTLKVLKEEKKLGLVKVYALSRELLGESREAEYLLNKYPALEEYSNKDNSVIVML